MKIKILSLVAGFFATTAYGHECTSVCTDYSVTQTMEVEFSVTCGAQPSQACAENFWFSYAQTWSFQAYNAWSYFLTFCYAEPESPECEYVLQQYYHAAGYQDYAYGRYLQYT